MSYATEADIIARYGQDAVTIAADRDGDGQSDEGVIDQALADAGSLIDSYLAVRYDLPLPQVPDALTRACVDIVMYQMAADCSVATEEQRRRYEQAIAYLRMLADGKASLGLESPPAEDPRTGSAAFTSATRHFTRDTLRGF